MITLESYRERLKSVYLSGTNEWGWVLGYLVYLTQELHVSWEEIETVEDEVLPEPDISHYLSLQANLDALLKSIPDSNEDWDGYLAHKIAIYKAMDDVIEVEVKLNPREQRARLKINLLNNPLP